MNNELETLEIQKKERKYQKMVKGFGEEQTGIQKTASGSQLLQHDSES